LSIPNWKLPEGVSRGTWDYLQSDSIAKDYDLYFRDSEMMRLDQDFVQRYLPANNSKDAPPVIADLGCGTGRISRMLSPMGYRMINVDLSPAMLAELERNCQYPQLNECICANLVELSGVLQPQSISMAVCLFSSIGMIRGRKNRQRFLQAVGQALRPAANLIVHVHNRYHSLWHPSGPSWLLGTWLRSRWKTEWEFGDRVYVYRGLPAMFLHIYSRRELIQDLKAAGFTSIQVFPINVPGNALLPDRFPTGLRAGGFFAIASHPNDQ
jgi:SAM-dependent methyltransferase